LSNDIKTADELRKWLARGYDRLNVGGGHKVLEGFINIDFAAHKNAQRAVIANILDLSFVPNESISHIHSNHVMEHLTDVQLAQQFREYHRILKKDGCISVRCPNALGAAYGFWFQPILESEKEEFVALGFPDDEDFGRQEDTWMHKDLFGLLHWFYGDVGNIQNEHLSIITPTKIKTNLVNAGFVIKKMTQPEAINIVLVANKQ
jgi:SAM-dependent methyltransferase